MIEDEHGFCFMLEDDIMTNTRKNITQPADWWVAFEKEADKAGMSLAAWVGQACLEKLPNHLAQKLSERQPAHRPKKPPPPRSR